MDLNTNIISKAHVINMGNTCNCSIDNKQQIVNFGTDVETLCISSLFVLMSRRWVYNYAATKWF